MSISDLYGSGEHLRNLGHFASIVHLAAADGTINAEEQVVLERFASKLNISDDEFKKILENPVGYPIHPNNSYQGRLERLYDLFTIIFSDHQIDDEETYLLKRYVIGLGFSSALAETIIKRSIQIFSGKLSFEDYQYLVDKK